MIPRCDSAGEGELDTVRTVLIDGDGLFGRGLEQVLDSLSAGVVAVVGRADDPRKAPDLLRRLRPQVAVIDLGPEAGPLPPGGSPVVAELHRGFPALRLLALMERVDVELALATLRCGAHGVLPRSSSPEELVAPLLSLASGHVVVPRGILTSLLGASVPRCRQVLDGVSPEDRELWRMVADGLETIQIAEKLFVSERTAKRMVASLLRRLGVMNRIQAAALAGQAGLLDDARPPSESAMVT